MPIDRIAGRIDVIDGLTLLRTIFSPMTQILRGFFGRAKKTCTSTLDSLPAEEQAFLERLRPMGLDWVTTRKQFEARFGVRQFHEFSKIVELPPTTIFTKEPLTFHFNYEPRLSDFPPEYIAAYFDTHRDARKNFLDAERQLTSVFGEGERSDGISSLRLKWRIGIFEVALCAWPSEGQPHYLTNTDATYYRYPELLEAATISISSSIAHIFPCSGLEWVWAALEDKPIPAGRQILRVSSNYKPFGLRYDIRRTRRNPPLMQEALDSGTVVAWKTEVPGAIGVTYRECSLFFNMQSDGGLILTRIRPARGSGGSEITVEETTCNDPKLGWGNRQIIFCHDDQLGLDDLSQQLASFWNVRLRLEECDAD